MSFWIINKADFSDVGKGSFSVAGVGAVITCSGGSQRWGKRNIFPDHLFIHEYLVGTMCQIPHRLYVYSNKQFSLSLISTGCEGMCLMLRAKNKKDKLKLCWEKIYNWWRWNASGQDPRPRWRTSLREEEQCFGTGWGHGRKKERSVLLSIVFFKWTVHELRLCGHHWYMNT